MTSAISSYGWNSMLSPSYSDWASIASGSNAINSGGLSSQTLADMNAAQTNSSLFSSSGNSSLTDGLYNTVSLNPSDYNAVYTANQVMTNALGGSSMSAQNFLAQMQQYMNPLFSSGQSDMSSLLSQSLNSSLENAAPNYFLSTFNPYSYLGSTTAGNLVNVLA